MTERRIVRQTKREKTIQRRTRDKWNREIDRYRGKRRKRDRHTDKERKGETDKQRKRRKGDRDKEK